MKNKTVTMLIISILLALSSSSIVLARTKEAKIKPCNEARSSWCIYKSVQVTFSLGHRVDVFKIDRGNVYYSLHIRIDDVDYYDTGTWIETKTKITVTETITDLLLEVFKGSKTSGWEILDPPGSGSTWIQFGEWDVEYAAASVGGSDLGEWTWGTIFTALESWR